MGAEEKSLKVYDTRELSSQRLEAHLEKYSHQLSLDLITCLLV